MELKDTDIGWVAGIIDGEGWIGLATNSRTILVQVGMTTPGPIAWLHKTFSGSLDIKKAKAGKCMQFVWTIRGEIARRFLETISPYMKLKAGEAELALEYYSTKADPGKEPTSRDILSKRDSIKSKLVRLRESNRSPALLLTKGVQQLNMRLK